MSKKLSSREVLIMEVLAARYRLGENIWPFNKTKKNLAAAEKLINRNFVFEMSGNVENTFRLGLMDEGKKMFLSATYVKGRS